MNKDLFRKASPKLAHPQMKLVAGVARCITYPDGTLLLKAGDPHFKFHVIKKGIIEVIDRSGDAPHVLLQHEASEFTGDLANLSGRGSNVDAVAKGSVEVYEIKAAELKQLISKQSGLGDTILEAFIARSAALSESAFTGFRIIGIKNDPDDFRIRNFLTKNDVLYTWIDGRESAGMEEFLSRFNITPEDLPVVIGRHKWILRNPSNVELAHKMGIRRKIKKTTFDVAIIGAGPAGLAAAVYGASEGLKTIALERFAPGGQAGSSSKIENYLGFPTGISGVDLASRSILQAEKFGAHMSIPSAITGLSFEKDDPVLHLENEEKVRARSLIIATGADYNRLDLPGIKKFEKRGVYYTASQIEATLCNGQPVAMIGGGNSAGQAAIFLSATVPRLYLIIRSGGLEHSMSSYLIQRIRESKNIELIPHTEITEIIGEDSINAIEITNNKTGKTQKLEVTTIFSFIGANPCSDWLPDEIERDDKGFIKTGQDLKEAGLWKENRPPFPLETSRPGVFAVGDVRSGSSKRVAAAVGEGSMAVQFIHRYLKIRNPETE